MEVCKKCGIEKDMLEFSKHKKYKGGFNHMCKICEKEYKRNNEAVQAYIKDYNKEYNKKYYAANKEYYKEYHKNKSGTYQRNRRLNDSFYKFNKNIRSLIKMSFKLKGIKKNSKTEQILGCSIKEFKEYIVNQFEDWMTLENNGIYTGNYNETWQIDHINPISNATNEVELIKLNHYTNLRPLCSRKNLEKSNNI